MVSWDVIGGKKGISVKIPVGGGRGERIGWTAHFFTSFVQGE